MSSLCSVQLEVWREPSLFLLRPTPMKWWLYGTDPPTSSWAPPSTPRPSTCGEQTQPFVSCTPFFHSSCQMCFLTHVHSFSSGVWAASFMKWSLGGLFSLDRLWRTSFTSYSASSVRQHSKIKPLCSAFKFCIRSPGSMFLYVHCLRTSFHLQICDAQVLPRKRRGPASPPARSLKPTNSLYTKLSLLLATHPGTLLEFPLPLASQKSVLL